MYFLQLHFLSFVSSCLFGLGDQKIKVTIRSHKNSLVAKEIQPFYMQCRLKHGNKSPFMFQGRENRMVTTP